MGLNFLPALERKEAIMRTHELLEDADTLIPLAESIATVFSEKHDDLNMNTEIEALLRASIAGATNGRNMYLSALPHARKSPRARKYLAETRRHCRHSMDRLRRRVRHSIAYLSWVIDEKRLIRSVNDAPLY